MIHHFLQLIPDHMKAGEIQCVLAETIIPTVARILPQALVCNNLVLYLKEGEGGGGYLVPEYLWLKHKMKIIGQTC